jgi:hypothetical protein
VVASKSSGVGSAASFSSAAPVTVGASALKLGSGHGSARVALHGRGIDTGIDEDALQEAGRLLTSVLARATPLDAQ